MSWPAGQLAKTLVDRQPQLGPGRTTPAGSVVRVWWIDEGAHRPFWCAVGGRVRAYSADELTSLTPAELAAWEASAELDQEAGL